MLLPVHTKLKSFAGCMLLEKSHVASQAQVPKPMCYLSPLILLLTPDFQHRGSVARGLWSSPGFLSIFTCELSIPNLLPLIWGQVTSLSLPSLGLVLSLVWSLVTSMKWPAIHSSCFGLSTILVHVGNSAHMNNEQIVSKSSSYA